jgi:hypothetical protein
MEAVSFDDAWFGKPFIDTLCSVDRFLYTALAAAEWFMFFDLVAYMSVVSSLAFMVIPLAVSVTSALWRIFFSTDKTTWASTGSSMYFLTFGSFSST